MLGLLPLRGTALGREPASRWPHGGGGIEAPPDPDKRQSWRSRCPRPSDRQWAGPWVDSSGMGTIDLHPIAVTIGVKRPFIDCTFINLNIGGASSKRTWASRGPQ